MAFPEPHNTSELGAQSNGWILDGPEPSSASRSHESLSRCYESIARFVDALAHKFGELSVLEICTSTNSASKAILDLMVDDDRNQGKRLSRYDVTNSYEKDSEEIQALSKLRTNVVAVRKLDITQDPHAQGFEDGTFDIIIGDDAPQPETTLQNCRKLLKTGGKLLLHVNNPKIDVDHSLNDGQSGKSEEQGVSPWQQWHMILSQSGYSRQQMLLPRSSDKNAGIQNVLIATAGADDTDLARPKVVLVEPTIHSPYSNSIVSALSSILAEDLVNTPCNIKDISDAGLHNKVCICLAELKTPFLNTCTDAEWLSIRKMLSSASNVLWITSGGAMDVDSAESYLIASLAHSSRSDNQALRLVTMDLDGRPRAPRDTARFITDVVDKAFVDRVAGELTKDVEYVERGGRMLIPRLMEDAQLQQYLDCSTAEPVPETQPFYQDRPLRLEVGTPGLLDSLRFVGDTTASLPLAADELTMKPMAYGVNFRDVMIALGQLEDISFMSSEHSGIVTGVGVDLVEQFHVGDRICAWGGNAYASSVKVNGMAAYQIPDDMTFETAASIPIVYATVCYAFVHLARLQKGESVLIHSAAGGVGQAAIMLAKHLDATIFVNIGSNEKKRLIMDNYGIPEDYI